MRSSISKWVLFFLALFFTASATLFEWQSFEVGYTAGDYGGPDTPQARQWIRDLKHQSNIYTAEAVACWFFALLCLGTALLRGNIKVRVAIYVGACLVCFLASFLPTYVTIRFHSP